MYTIIYVNLINIEVRIGYIILCVYDVIIQYYSGGVLLMYGTTGIVFDVVGAALGTHTAYEIKKKECLEVEDMALRSGGFVVEKKRIRC